MTPQILELPPSRRGLHDITRLVSAAASVSGVQNGLCNIFLPHTSASLLIQENASPEVLHDLADFFLRLVPDGDPRYRHTIEGRDDMSAHIRSALTQTSISIPIVDGALAFGTWQTIYLFEHRFGPMRRRLIVTAVG